MSHVWDKMTDKIDKITNIFGQVDERMKLLGQDDDIYIAMVSSSCPSHLAPAIHLPKTDIQTLFGQQTIAHFWVNSFHNRMYLLSITYLTQIVKVLLPFHHKTRMLFR